MNASVFVFLNCFFFSSRGYNSALHGLENSGGFYICSWIINPFVNICRDIVFHTLCQGLECSQRVLPPPLWPALGVKAPAVCSHLCPPVASSVVASLLALGLWEQQLVLFSSNTLSCLKSFESVVSSNEFSSVFFCPTSVNSSALNIVS